MSTEEETVYVRWLAIGPANAEAIQGWRATLSGDERAQADRLRREDDRAAFIAAHALARCMLSRVSGLPQDGLRFTHSAAGKPLIHPSLNSDLDFSISHTRGFAGVAVALNHWVGIDVERPSRINDHLSVANRFFHPAERETVRRSQDQATTFLRFWTLKEAFVKATGEGLACGLSRFAIQLDPPTITFAPGSSAVAREWTLYEEHPTPDFLLAVAVRHRSIGRVRFDVAEARSSLHVSEIISSL